MTDAPRFEMGHIGVYVTDLDRMTDFYGRVLGFKITDGGAFGESRMAFLSRNAGHHHQIVFITGRPAGPTTRSTRYRSRCPRSTISGSITTR